MEFAIRAEGLTKAYGAHLAVKSLSLDVPAGSVFGFLGPNGAGKTTTIRMLLGLIRPTSGSATVLGVDVVRQRPKLSSLVGAIVEVPAFYPHLSGAENLRAMALSSGHALERTESDRLLELVGLTRDGKVPVKKYSLGMKQRLGLAVALMGDPQVLFLDEPTNGLDPDGAREIRELIGSLRQAGRTLFVSSHLLQEVERFCTDVAIVQHDVDVFEVRPKRSSLEELFFDATTAAQGRRHP
ncbi:MAG TPA: ATP-binding cassette domain-containing protein [Myxococcaceae bacterium]|nr:ATP-binding cassette domain-containing protein [Myxococcaceae bacterium]